MAMRIRRKIYPRRLLDLLCFLLVGVFLPIVFIFEIIVVLPAFHESGSFLYTFTFLLAMFLIFNIKGNMLATMMVDTSVDYKTITIPEQAESKGWFHCDRCKALAPPRSYHCKVCRTCILKSDHHCVFTGCCIGHFNHRYFALFVLYMFIGSTYAFVYNTAFLWFLHADKFQNMLSVYKMICPVLMVVHGSLWTNLPLLFYNLNIIAVTISSILLVYHGKPILRGGVSSERRNGYQYDSGLRRNLETIFGKRMHLVWLAPFFESELPDSGVNWITPTDSTPTRAVPKQYIRRSQRKQIQS